MDAPQLCVRFGIRMDETWLMVDESSAGVPASALLWLPVGVWTSMLRTLAVSPMASYLRLCLPGHFRTTWTTGVGLGAATVGGSLVAGLLGPVAIFVCALVISLPAWIAVWWFARRA